MKSRFINEIRYRFPAAYSTKLGFIFRKSHHTVYNLMLESQVSRSR